MVLSKEKLWEKWEKIRFPGNGLLKHDENFDSETGASFKQLAFYNSDIHLPFSIFIALLIFNGTIFGMEIAWNVYVKNNLYFKQFLRISQRFWDLGSCQGF